MTGKSGKGSAARGILTCGGILIGAVLAGFLLLLAVYALPTGRMKENVSESLEMLEKEGDYPSWGGAITMTTLDQFTDAIMIKTAIAETGGSLVERALLNPCLSPVKDSGTQQTDLIRAAVNGENSGGEIYYNFRYWNGYLVILKPLLLLFNIGELRVISMFLQALLLFWCLTLVRKRLGGYYAFGFLAAVLLMAPISVALCLQYQNTYYIALITTIVILKKGTTGTTLFVPFLLSGISAAFFDMLTVPLITLSIPLAICLAVSEKEDGITWKKFLFPCLAWGIGYGVMWFGKWALATLLTHENVIQNAIDEVLVRSSGAVEGEKIRYLDVAVRNLKAVGKPGLLILGIAAAGTVVWLWKRYGKHFAWKASKAWYLAVIAFPFLWYFVTQNHSYVHALFTHRLFAGSVLAGFSLLGSIAGAGKAEGLDRL